MSIAQEWVIKKKVIVFKRGKGKGIEGQKQVTCIKHCSLIYMKLP